MMNGWNEQGLTKKEDEGEEENNRSRRKVKEKRNRSMDVKRSCDENVRSVWTDEKGWRRRNRSSGDEWSTFKE